MTMATFRFHAELNIFLPARLRQRTFAASYARHASVKHTIEALGVPHTEVGRIVINGEATGFERPLADGDSVVVYPPSERASVPLRSALPEPLWFLADAHLGRLARLLRMAGFDTLYDNRIDDRDVERIAAQEQRIVLTRDRELLKRRGIEHGCYVRALDPLEQLREVAARLSLHARARPWRLCLHCNAPLRRIDKADVLARIPPSVRERCDRFATCDVCGRIYWEGSHWQRMSELMDEVLGVRAATASRATP
ncbi:Mut7-C RNAse domain-containing protein [Mycetohabitans rhizoxinica]|uniref:Mut7-C ubiquitin/RNAse domain-containing protein n=1 Tax=Mycetohabitans rhizoxinica TaxID=412963 RepID=A0ABZ2PZD4_9BURK